MIRVQFGKRAVAFEDMEARLRESEALLKVAREKFKSAQAGWITTAAQLEDVQQYADQLLKELQDTQAAYEIAMRACADREVKLEAVSS